MTITATTLGAECPRCERALKPVPFFHAATSINTRTCRYKNCGAKWQIKTTVLICNEEMAAHELSFVEIIPPEQLAQLRSLREHLEGSKS